MDETARLPVTRAISATFAFFAEHWLDVLRISWLPLLLQFLILRLLSNSAAFPLAAAVIGIATNAIMATGLMKLVLRGETPRLPFYLAFGQEELRVTGTWCVIALLAMAVGAVFVIAAAAAGAIFSAVPGIGALLSVVLTLVMLAAPVWALLRLSLSTPAAVVGPTIGVVPSWRRTANKIWPLFGYWLVWVGFLLVVNWALYAVLLPDYYAGLADIMRAPVADRPAMVEDLQLRLSGQMDLTSLAGIGRNITFLLAGLVSTALFLLAGGVAWRMMVEATPAGPAGAPEAKGPWG